MSEITPLPVAPDLREHLAAERTILEYVRTGLAMMSIGFVLARFSLMLRMLQTEPLKQSMSYHHTGLSLWIGTVLGVSGSLVNFLSSWQYWLHVHSINQIKGYRVHASLLAMSLAIGLGIMGVFMAMYLVISTK
jgi:putative membrane protein